MISKSIYQPCKKCNKTFDAYSKWGTKSYCSRACANSRGPRSEEFKQRMKDLYSGKPRDLTYLIKYNQTIEKRAPRPICKVCGKKCKGLAFITCSRECFKTLCATRPKKGRSHKGTYKGYNCDSTYELAFLIWHLDHGIKISKSANVYDYIFDNKIRKYNPDFIVNNAEYEIKGYMCDQSQAKLDQNPHIKLIDKESIKPYMKYVKEKYNVKNLKDLYE